MEINTDKLNKIEDKLITEICENGTEKMHKLFIAWQDERLRLNDIWNKELDKILHKDSRNYIKK